MKWVLVKITDDYVICEGIFSKQESAVCAAFENMSRDIQDNDKKTAVCSEIYNLEADSGIGFHYEIEDYGLIQIYILEGEDTIK